MTEEKFVNIRSFSYILFGMSGLVLVTLVVTFLLEGLSVASLMILAVVVGIALLGVMVRLSDSKVPLFALAAFMLMAVIFGAGVAYGVLFNDDDADLIRLSGVMSALCVLYAIMFELYSRGEWILINILRRGCTMVDYSLPLEAVAQQSNRYHSVSYPSNVNSFPHELEASFCR